MKEHSDIDHGKFADWGLTSTDYAIYRPGYPQSFFERLKAIGIGLAGQRILDLGCGTGVLARQFARQGSIVTGVDVSEGQINAARALSERDNLQVDYIISRAEETDLLEESFDVMTASQCWVYFEKDRIIPEVKRLLRPGGRLMTSHLCWLPRVDRIARETEALVLEHNPNWTSGDWDGKIVYCPDWARGHFLVDAMFYYDEPLLFTHESWRGRIRACRGVGATLSPAQVKKFDREHAGLLSKRAPAEFAVLHRIDAHILRPI